MDGERESSREKRDGKRIEAKTPPNRDFDMVYKEKTNYPSYPDLVEAFNKIKTR